MEKKELEKIKALNEAIALELDVSTKDLARHIHKVDVLTKELERRLK